VGGGGDEFVAVEDTIRWAGDFGSELGGGDRKDGSRESGLTEDLDGEFVPRTIAGASEVVRSPGSGANETGDASGEFEGRGGSTALIVDDLEVVAFAGEPEHRLDEVPFADRSGATVDATGADDEVLRDAVANGFFTGEFAAAVGSEGSGGVVFGVVLTWRRGIRNVLQTEARIIGPPELSSSASRGASSALSTKL